MWFNTKAVVLTSGIGDGSSEIVAFDSALRGAAIADFNLIKVTSIVPPQVPVYKMKEGSTPICGDGRMLPTVYIMVSSTDPNEILSTAVGVGVPEDRTKCGVIFVNSGKDLPETDCVTGLQEMITEGMANLRRNDAYSFEYASASSSQIASTGKWHSVMSALSFVDDDLWPYFKDQVELVSKPQ